MRPNIRLSVAAAIVLLSAATACGSDSTGPPRGVDRTPGILAQHLDTLSASARASSATDANFTFRSTVLSELELAAAFGAAPTSITVTTASGTEQWKGFVYEEVMKNSGTASDSATFIIAYRDSLVHTAMITILDGLGASLGSRLLTNDTLSIAATSHSGTTSRTSTGSACPAPIAGLGNPIIASGSAATCVSAVFNAGQTLGFPSTSGVDPALTSLSFGATSFAGERFFDALPSASRVQLSSFLLQMLRAAQ